MTIAKNRTNGVEIKSLSITRLKQRNSQIRNRTSRRVEIKSLSITRLKRSHLCVLNLQLSVEIKSLSITRLKLFGIAAIYCVYRSIVEIKSLSITRLKPCNARGTLIPRILVEIKSLSITRLKLGPVPYSRITVALSRN